MMTMPAEVTPQPGFQTSPMFEVKGQSDFFYPDKRISPENTELIVDMNLTERGTARRRFGYGKFNATVIEEATVAKSVVGFHQEKFASGTTVNLERAGTKIYTDNGTTRADITGLLTLTDSPDDRTVSAFIKNNIIGTNGVDETWAYPGTGNAAVLGGVPWTTCVGLVTHKNLLIALGTTESGTYFPTRIRWPDVSLGDFGIDITNWPTDSKFEVQQGGKRIVAGVDAYDFLAVAKEDGIHLVRFTLDEGFIEAVPDRSLTGAFSPIAKKGFLYHPEFGMWVITKDGAYIVSPQLEFRLVTGGIGNEWKTILNKGRIQFAHSFVRETDHQIRTLMSSSANTSGHDRTLVYDWQNGDVWFETLDDKANIAESFTVSNVEYDVYGTTDGFIMQGNDSSKSKDDDADINWKITMSPNDLGFPGRDKVIHSIITHHVTKTGTQAVNLTTFLNEGRLAPRTFNLTLGTTLTWDSGLLWDSGLQWPGEGSDIDIQFVNRVAQTIAPQWEGTADFELKGYQIVWSPAE